MRFGKRGASVTFMIDDVPADVTVQLKRAKHLVNKCILLIEDDQVVGLGCVGLAWLA